MNVTNNITKQVGNYTNCNNNSMLGNRRIEEGENEDRRNDNPLSLLALIEFDPFQDIVSYDSLETIRQLRLVCKALANLAFKFFDNESKTQIVVLFKFEELYSKIDRSVKEKYEFVNENNLDIALVIRGKDLKKYGKLELQLKERGNAKIVLLEVDRSLPKPSFLDYLLRRNVVWI